MTMMFEKMARKVGKECRIKQWKVDEYIDWVMKEGMVVKTKIEVLDTMDLFLREYL